MIDLPVKSEPVMVIMGAGVAAVNAVLAVILAFVPVEPSQAAVLVAVVNPLAALLLAIATRGRVSPVKESSHGM